MKKIFISHSHCDKYYARNIVDLLERIGLNSKEIMCTSLEGYGVNFGEDFLEVISEKLKEVIIVIFLLSKDYYKSPISLCEMGACWILAKKTIPILIPPFTDKDIEGVFKQRLSFSIDHRTKLSSFKELIEDELNIEFEKQISTTIWDGFRERFLKNIENKKSLENKSIDESENKVIEFLRTYQFLNNDEVFINSLVIINPGVFYRLFDSEKIKVDKPFAVSKFPITQEVYEKVNKNNPSYFKGLNNPVENVSFLQAITFCNNLSEIDGYDHVYTIKSDGVIEFNSKLKGYRLPFEYEFDYLFDLLSQEYEVIFDLVPWLNKNSNNQTHSVENNNYSDAFIIDLIGNVWEWCFDNYLPKVCYEKYDDNRVIIPDSKIRVLKGGSYSSIQSTIKNKSFRTKQTQDKRNKNCGFRIILQNIN